MVATPSDRVPSPTEEILAIRDELAARMDYDIHRIAEEARRRQLESGRTYVSLSKRPPQPQTNLN